MMASVAVEYNHFLTENAALRESLDRALDENSKLISRRNYLDAGNKNCGCISFGSAGGIEVRFAAFTNGLRDPLIRYRKIILASQDDKWETIQFYPTHATLIHLCENTK